MQFVIIGNGIAGISAAHAIRSLRPEDGITIVSEESDAGYTACLIPDYLSGGIDRKQIFIKYLNQYQRDGIRLISEQRVNSIDTKRREVTIDSDFIPYDKLIIATGSKALLPPVGGVHKQGIFTLKSLVDADSILKWQGRIAVVVGSGAVGVEAAIALKIRGYTVTMLEFSNTILPQAFDEYPANLVKEILETGGIRVYTGEKAVEVIGDEKVKGMLTDKRKIPCDTVIMAVGMKPDVRIAAGAIQLGQFGGIKVDDQMRTSVQDIYACGDCVETKSLLTGLPALSMFWHNARIQGFLAGSNAVCEQRRYPGSLNISIIDLFGVQAVSIGQRSVEVTKRVQVLEREKNRGYQRLILVNGTPVGAQSIDWSENMGALLSAIMRGDKIADLNMWAKLGRPYYAVLRHAPVYRGSTL